MVHDKDKILICLSGGKDSLSLLHAMKQYQHIARSKVVFICMEKFVVLLSTDTHAHGFVQQTTRCFAKGQFPMHFS